jgi:hypothetical protein
MSVDLTHFCFFVFQVPNGELSPFLLLLPQFRPSLSDSHPLIRWPLLQSDDPLKTFSSDRQRIGVEKPLKDE